MSDKIEGGGACFVLLVLFPLAVVFEGVVVMLLWRWFVVPLAVAPLSIVHAAGIATLVQTLRPSRAPSESTWSHVVGATFLAPAFALALGFVLSRFM